ncbi:hypothetical protein D3C81_473880 [compost metagenome]
MAVISQGRVGLCITVQVIDEAVEQFISGVEIQKLGVARIALLKHRPQAAHPRRQTFLVSRQRRDQPCGIGAGQGAAAEAIEQFGQILQTRFDRRHRMIGAAAAQTFQQLVQGVETGGDAHELAVQTTEPTVAPTHVRVFEHGDAAQSFQAYGLSDEAHVAGFEGLRPTAAAQAVGDEQGEHAEALIQGIAHGGAGGLRQDRGADQGRAENPQGDFQHSPHRHHEGTVGMRQRRQSNHCCGIAGQHKTVGAEITTARRAGRADANPDRQRAKKQFGVLREQSNQRHHHRRPGQGAEEAVETLGEHLTTLRLHDDEHSNHRRARLRQLQAHRQPQREERRDQHLENVHPGHAVAACPVEETPAPFKGIQPAQRCGQGGHEILLIKIR